MLVVHVHVHVKPERVEAFKQATIANARESLREPGIAAFDCVQQQGDPTRFVLVEAYRMRRPRGPQGHETLRDLRDTAAPMMAEPRTSVKYANLFPTDADW